MTAPPEAAPAAAAAPPAGRWYMVSPAYDWFNIILPPLFALVIGMAIAGRVPTQIGPGPDGKDVQPPGAIFIGMIIHAHLVAVFLRSHNNPGIFKLYKWRFTLVPIAVWVAIVASPWIAVAATVVATFWDVWHSGAQTFGFARIYDRNHGQPPETGRLLDFWLNQLLYAGPVLAGVVLASHLYISDFRKFGEVGSPFLATVPVRVLGVQRYLTLAVLAGGTLFLVFYVFSYWRYCRQGYRFPFVKVFLLVSTGLCSIYTWGFNTWGEAYFIMNLFHAWQYFAVVWAMEKKRILERLGLAGVRGGSAIALVAFFGVVLAYGYFAATVDIKFTALWALTVVVSLMHFWYDGFVWSVRKGQV